MFRLWLGVGIGKHWIDWIGMVIRGWQAGMNRIIESHLLSVSIVVYPRIGNCLEN